MCCFDFSSSLMHCCIIYILQIISLPPALTQSHISPGAVPLGGIGRIDHIVDAGDLWEMGRHRGCNILIPPPWLRPFDAWRGSTRLTYSKSSTLVHTLLLSPFFLHCRVRESRCRPSCHTCLDRDEEYIWGERFSRYRVTKCIMAAKKPCRSRCYSGVAPIPPRLVFYIPSTTCEIN